jgi:hypothetical protein
MFTKVEGTIFRECLPTEFTSEDWNGSAEMDGLDVEIEVTTQSVCFPTICTGIGTELTELALPTGTVLL